MLTQNQLPHTKNIRTLRYNYLLKKSHAKKAFHCTNKRIVYTISRRQNIFCNRWRFVFVCTIYVHANMCFYVWHMIQHSCASITYYSVVHFGFVNRNFHFVWSFILYNNRTAAEKKWFGTYYMVNKSSRKAKLYFFITALGVLK